MERNFSLLVLEKKMGQRYEIHSRIKSVIIRDYEMCCVSARFIVLPNIQRSQLIPNNADDVINRQMNRTLTPAVEGQKMQDLKY